MKSISALSLGALLLAVSLSAQNTAPAVPQVDPAATALWREHIEGMGDRGTGERGVNFDAVSGKALEFFEKYPNERRVGGILFNLASFGGWMKGAESEKVRAEWQQHLQRVLAGTLANKQWPDNVWAGLHWVAGKNDLAIAMDSAGKPDLAALRARIATVADRTPESPYRTFLVQELLGLMEKHEPAKVDAYLHELAGSDVADLANLGKGQLAIRALRATPMELKFTAVDGREVDVSKLRGQVVLIDCWATWCVPCIKELPNIKAAREKWGDKGFTVVGISFDKPADKAKLVKFIEDEKLVWPHWLNEAGGKHPFGAKYNIRSIPATFLLGKDGRLVTTDTHGENLEKELQKLLGE